MNEWQWFHLLQPPFLFFSFSRETIDYMKLWKWHLFTVSFLLFWVYGIICSENMQLLSVRSLFYTWLLSLRRERNIIQRWEKEILSKIWNILMIFRTFTIQFEIIPPMFIDVRLLLLFFRLQNTELNIFRQIHVKCWCYLKFWCIKTHAHFHVSKCGICGMSVFGSDIFTPFRHW